MNVFPNQSFPNLRSHLVLSLISQKCPTFVWVWDLWYLQWNYCCFWKFFPMNTADSIVTAINILQIIECSSPSLATLEILFLSFPHLIIHPIHEWSWFYSISNTVSFVSHDEIFEVLPLLENIYIYILSGRPDLSRSVSPFLTDCAVPSRRISSWSGRTFLTILQEVLSGRPDRSYVVVSVFPLLRRPNTVVIQFWITCWREAFHENCSWQWWSQASNKSVPLSGRPRSVFSSNWCPWILTSVMSLHRAYWSWGRHDRWHPRSEIHHWSRFCCDSFFFLNRVEIASPLQQSKL